MKTSSNGADEPQPHRGVGLDPLSWLALLSRESSGSRRIRPNGTREARAIAEFTRREAVGVERNVIEVLFNGSQLGLL